MPIKFEDIPSRYWLGGGSLGEGYNLIRDMIKKDLLQEKPDLTDITEIFFEVEKRLTEILKDKPTYRERQEEWMKSQNLTKLYGISLTEEELEYLKFKLDGVNDPVGDGILKKLVGIRKKSLENF